MQLFETALAAAAGTGMLLLVLQATIILLIALGGNALARRNSAATRHFWLALAFVQLLLLPVLNITTPVWQLRLPDDLATAGPPAPAAPTATGEEGSALPATSPMLLTERGPATFDPGFALIAFWLAGFLLLLIRDVQGYFAMRAIERNAIVAQEPRLRTALNEACRRIGMRRPPVLQLSSAIAVPVTWRLRRPVILLPAAASGWSQSRLRAVLLHELAHIRRRDWAVQGIAQLACALYWFLPLAWLALRRLRSLHEQACDAEVVASGERASVYAGHLLEIARFGRSRRLALAAGVAMARTTQLEARIQALLQTAPSLQRPAPGHLLCLGLIALLIAFTLSGFRPPQTTTIPPAVLRQVAAERGPEMLTIIVQTSLPPQHEDFRQHDTEFLLAAARAEDAQVRLQAVHALMRRSGSGISGALLEAARSAGLHSVSGALSGFGDRRIQAALTAALADSQWQIRHLAVEGLRRLGDPVVLPAVEPLLADPDWRVRHLAVWAIADLAGSTATPALCSSLADPVWQVSHLAAWHLGRLNDKRATSALIAALGGADWERQHVAAWALGHLGDRSAVEPLQANLRHPAWQVRKEAALALGRLQATEARGSLAAMRIDPNDRVRAAVQLALEQIN